MLKPNARSKGNSERSESITFRMAKPILDELRQEAEHKLKSINTLVNQIVKLYITWHKPAKQAGYGYFDKVLVSDIINLLSDEQIVKMAEQYCKNRLKDIAFMLNGENTFSSFMESFISWLEASSFNYKYSINNNNNDNSSTLVIQFDMGKNWSLFFKTYMQQVLEYYEIAYGQCEMTENTVVIRISNNY
jgi:RNA binding exosome subunit